MTSHMELSQSKVLPKRIPSHAAVVSKVFDPDISYEVILNKMKVAFNQKWEQNIPSPSTGLSGFQNLGILGRGSYGKVKLVKERESGNYFAAKIMAKDLIVKTKQVSHVFNEKKVLQCIRFPFLLLLEFSAKDNDNLYLGLPIISGGELFTYHRKMRKFNEKTARFYGAQVFLALEYLHHMNLLYRDLKPENILIDKHGYIKLTDYGFTKRVETRTASLCGTPEYLAPEIIQSKPYGQSVDWWSYGILLYEFVNGSSPFAPHNNDVMLMYVKICDGDFKMPAFFSTSLKKLIHHLLQVDISKRFGSLSGGNKDIKNHDWFENVHWYGLLNREVQPPFIPTIKNVEDLSNFEFIKEKPFTESTTCLHDLVFMDF